MRAWNRAKLLWGYLTRTAKLSGLPVEYIVETTAKCNLYCPMCPRETYAQPKEDMADDIFERLVQGHEANAQVGVGHVCSPKVMEVADHGRAEGEKFRERRF